MNTSQVSMVVATIVSATGRTVADIVEAGNGFGFYHLRTEEFHDGFATIQEAKDAAWDHHTDWFENL